MRYSKKNEQKKVYPEAVTWKIHRTKETLAQVLPGEFCKVFKGLVTHI